MNDTIFQIFTQKINSYVNSCLVATINHVVVQLEIGHLLVSLLINVLDDHIRHINYHSNLLVHSFHSHNDDTFSLVMI